MSVHDENDATVYKCPNCNEYYTSHLDKDRIERHTSGECKKWTKLKPFGYITKSDLNYDEYFLRHVYLAASKSKDFRTKIGAVLVRDKNIISTGFNGFPIGVDDFEYRYENRETKYKFIVHAEMNSVLSAARHGISTLGSVLYSQGIPCCECSKALIQGGIKTVICHKQWPNLIHSKQWVESIEISKIMLGEAGIDIRWLDMKLGIKGFLDGAEIDV